MVCDVPYVGKRWVHQVVAVRHRAGHLLLDQELPDRGRGATTSWRASREYEYYDPIYMLPQRGQDWWRSRAATADAATTALPA